MEHIYQLSKSKLNFSPERLEHRIGLVSGEWVELMSEILTADCNKPGY